jgi:hypothetical protein
MGPAGDKEVGRAARGGGAEFVGELLGEGLDGGFTNIIC